MGSYGDTTTGVASAIRSFIKSTGSSRVQIMRRHRTGAAPTITAWTATSTGSSNVVAASVDRTSMLIVSKATAEVYVRFDATIPFVSSATYSYFLAPGDRWEVPEDLIECAVSLAAAATGGTVYITTGADA